MEGPGNGRPKNCCVLNKLVYPQVTVRDLPMDSGVPHQSQIDRQWCTLNFDGEIESPTLVISQYWVLPKLHCYKQWQHQSLDLLFAYTLLSTVQFLALLLLISHGCKITAARWCFDSMVSLWAKRLLVHHRPVHDVSRVVWLSQIFEFQISIGNNINIGSHFPTVKWSPKMSKWVWFRLNLHPVASGHGCGICHRVHRSLRGSGEGQQTSPEGINDFWGFWWRQT